MSNNTASAKIDWANSSIDDMDPYQGVRNTYQTLTMVADNLRSIGMPANSPNVFGEEVTVQKHREYVAGQLRIYAGWLQSIADELEQPQIVAPKNEEMGE